MMEKIIIRSAVEKNDLSQLISLYNTVFSPEKVGDLAEIFYNYLPDLPSEYWLLAEDLNANKIVAALVLIPWKWQMQGLEIKVAEMGIVATSEEYRGKGLMHTLNQAFEKLAIEKGFLISGIQGIPGFYYKLGYEYAVDMENHINVPLRAVNNNSGSGSFNFRLANKSDIPFLLEQDADYQKCFGLTVVRSEKDWEYILNKGKDTDYGSEIWITENGQDKFYFRILMEGFGCGLIVTEISENITTEALQGCFNFMAKLADKYQKPFLRLNMHKNSNAVKYLVARGISESKSYAWQVKIFNKLNLLNKVIPLFESRIKNSVYKNFKGILRLNFYSEFYDLTIQEGKISILKVDGNEEQAYTFSINARWFASLVLGHRSWEELNEIHPDVMPEMLYLDPVIDNKSAISGELASILFPKLNGWINMRY